MTSMLSASLLTMANSIARITLSVDALALRVEHLQANQARGRRDADVRARGETRDVRAVTVPIGWRGHANVAVREVVERGNARAEIEAGRDARVDHRHADRRAC